MKCGPQLSRHISLLEVIGMQTEVKNYQFFVTPVLLDSCHHNDWIELPRRDHQRRMRSLQGENSLPLHDAALALTITLLTFESFNNLENKITRRGHFERQSFLVQTVQHRTNLESNYEQRQWCSKRQLKYRDNTTFEGEWDTPSHVT